MVVFLQKQSQKFRSISQDGSGFLGLFGREKPSYNAVLQIRRDTEDNSEIIFLTCIFQQNLRCDPSLNCLHSMLFMEKQEKNTPYFFPVIPSYLKHCLQLNYIPLIYIFRVPYFFGYKTIQNI